MGIVGYLRSLPLAYQLPEPFATPSIVIERPGGDVRTLQAVRTVVPSPSLPENRDIPPPHDPMRRRRRYRENAADALNRLPRSPRLCLRGPQNLSRSDR